MPAPMPRFNHGIAGLPSYVESELYFSRTANRMPFFFAVRPLSGMALATGHVLHRSMATPRGHVLHGDELQFAGFILLSGMALATGEFV